MSKAAPPTWRSAGGPPTVQQQAPPPQQWSRGAAPPPQAVPQQQQQAYGGDDSDNEMSNGGLPPQVVDFIYELYQAMVANDVPAVRYMYYKQWKDLTKSFYENNEWPSAEAVAPIVEDNEVFLLCYRELCYRQILMNRKATLVHRIESWNNYRNLFDMFLDGALTSKMALPLEWLYDMIEEFLYQWHNFYYDYKPQDQAELELLRENQNVWKVQTVLGYLTSFVERSQITRDLTTAQASSSQGQATVQQPVHYTILKALGAFSLVGLSRAQVLLADYRYAIRVLDAVDIDDQRAIFTQVTPCAVTLFYNLGFAYLMSRRYADALQMFSRALSHRTAREVASSHAEENMIMMTKRFDKIVALAALCQRLSPGVKVDESVRRLINNQLPEYDQDQPMAMFEELFTKSCPKFVNPATRPYLLPKPEGQDQINAKGPADAARETLRVQLKWFLEDARQQVSLPTIRSVLKLYKSIPVDKLSRFCQMDMDHFRQNLVFIKARSSQIVRGISDGSAPIDGTRTSVSDVQFYVVGDKNPVNDMVHIVAGMSSRQQNNPRSFLDQSLNLQNFINSLQKDMDPIEDEDLDEPMDDYDE